MHGSACISSLLAYSLYRESEHVFFILAEKSEELFLDKLMTGFLQTIDELSNVSFHFTF